MNFKERHLEEVSLKAAGIAGLGGILGAGLDVYFNGGQHLKDFAKPVAAWGLGGALSGLLQNDGTPKVENDKKIQKVKAKKKFLNKKVTK
jgi:hypothetical protein